jgi:hypothetical protein
MDWLFTGEKYWIDDLDSSIYILPDIPAIVSIHFPERVTSAEPPAV